jgi:hypothetical protein
MIETGITETVEDWLRVIGCTPVEETDPQTHWHVHIDYPVKTPNMLHVIVPKDNQRAVVIISALTLNPEHASGFENLDDEGKEEFMFELRMMLNSVDTDFSIEGLTGPHDTPKRIQISALRFPDGLTLDSFARSIGAVYKMQLNAILLIQRRLGTGGFGPSGRFDFKRIGL